MSHKARQNSNSRSQVVARYQSALHVDSLRKSTRVMSVQIHTSLRAYKRTVDKSIVTSTVLCTTSAYRLGLVDTVPNISGSIEEEYSFQT